MQQYSAKHYLDIIRQELPEDIFKPVPSRLLWLPTHLSVLALSWWALLTPSVHWSVQILLIFLIGHSFACLGFLGHELLHGSIVKRGRMQTFFSWLSLLPYCIGPEHWRAWHNREHHNHTARPGTDPDSLANYPIYLRSRVLRFVESITPGSGLIRSFFYFFYFFTFQAAIVLFHHGRVRNYWKGKKRWGVLATYFLNVSIWTGVALLVGGYNFLFIYVFPLMVGNFISMSYIATNHFLNEQTPKVNDPLVNSLSVRVGWLFEWLHLGFNYHVEHHVVPSMSSRHGPKVREVLKKHFPDRYREMPMWKAWYLLFARPSLHWTDDTLVNPRTGELCSTVEADQEPERLGKLPKPVPGPRKRDPLEMLEESTPLAESRRESQEEPVRKVA